ncbi:MAG: sigma-70 family RNA polymerase sigma factor [Planctomycetia bacterium]|nr:sigma-70 family RNA polymerase sigma factor [Planctomycetia bacterium]
MALAEIDRNLIERCLQKTPRAWEDFVDRYIGLINHVVRLTCKNRNLPLDSSLQEDLIQEIFMAIVADNFVVLRRFRGHSSLATYLAVVARRIVVKSLMQKNFVRENVSLSEESAPIFSDEVEKRIEDKDEVERLLATLGEKDANIVRLFHLEQKSYAEIAAQTGVPENSIGPILSRARETMRASVASDASLENNDEGNLDELERENQGANSAQAGEADAAQAPDSAE